MGEGLKTAAARPVASGFRVPEILRFFRVPDPLLGLVDASGCASLRSSHLQVISICILKKWRLWCLDIKNAPLQAEPPRRDVFPQAPPDGESSDSRRFWELNAPAFGLFDAPVVFRRTLRKFPLNSVESLKAVGLIYKGSSFDPCLYFIFD